MSEDNHHILNFSQRHQGQEEAKEEDFIFFSALRQYGATPPMISFVMRDGNRYALPTSALGEIWLRQNRQVISLKFHNAEVEIEGRNLLALYEKLLLRKVREIREIIQPSQKPEESLGSDALFISRIEYDSENWNGGMGG